MKNIYTKNEFLAIRNQGEMINENLFSFIGGMFNKLKGYINKVQGGKEIEAIYTKYIGKIQDEIKNKVQIDLQLKEITTDRKTESLIINEETIAPPKQTVKPAGANQKTAPAGAVPPAGTDQKTEPAPPAGTDQKTKVEELKNKQLQIQQILDTYKNLAIKEMDNVLVQKGGKGKNPQLASIIEIKKEQFGLDLINAKIKIYNEAGDKSTVAKLTEIQKQLSTKIQTLTKTLETNKISTEINIGGKKIKTTVPYRYKKKDGTIQTIKPIRIDNGKLIASYTYGKSKDKEQIFDPNNVDVDFKPEINKEYNYSNNNAQIIKIKTLTEPDANGNIQVQSKNSKFTVNKGSLIDIKEKTTA